MAVKCKISLYSSAVSLGTQMLELDCHLTKDGQVVVSHDCELKRTCDCDGNISDTFYNVSMMFKNFFFICLLEQMQQDFKVYSNIEL